MDDMTLRSVLLAVTVVALLLALYFVLVGGPWLALLVVAGIAAVVAALLGRDTLV